MRLRRDSGRSQVVEETRHEAPPEVANVGFHLLEPVAQSKRYAITNVDSLGVIERFTFAEVVRETARWAQLLRANGLQPGDRVLVLAGREWGWRCALLGVMRAGGVAVPCPASLPLREIRAVAANAGASLLVSLSTRPDFVELDGRAGLTADDLDAIDASEALEQPPHLTEPRDIALILYSWRGLDLTGTMHSHASLLAQAEAADDWLGVADEERIWSTADEGSGASIWLLLAALRRAASIVVVDLDLEPEGTLELLDRLRPAAVWFSDEEYAALGAAEVPPWVDLRSIRRALVSDAVVDGATAFASAFGAAVTPVFGLDELGVVAGWPAGRERAAAAGRAQPVSGVHVAVHDDDKEELPPGEIGDVVVRGDSPALFTGYTSHEHGRSRSAAWFRVGWRGSLTRDGTLVLADMSPTEVEPAGPMVEMPAPDVAEEPRPEPKPVEEEHAAGGWVARRTAERAKRGAEAEIHRLEEAEVRERADREAADAAERQRGEEEQRHREEEERRARAEQQAADAEARRVELEREDEERRRREEAEAREQAEREAAEAAEGRRLEKERRREEKDAREREAREAKEREKHEVEERRRAEEEAKIQAKVAEAEAKQRAKDEKQLEKERAREEKEREKREAEEAKIQQKIAAAEAKRRAEDEKRREREREREEKEARRSAEKEAKEAARAARKEKRPEPKPAPADKGRRFLSRRRRQGVVEEPERGHVEIDVVARIKQYGMAAAPDERPAEPPEQGDDEQQERQPSTD